MPAYVDRLTTRLRQSLPSLHVDHGSRPNYKHGVYERWLRWETVPPSHFSGRVESRSCESVPGDPQHTILVFELSVPFTLRQLSDKLTSSLRSLRTLGRLSPTRVYGRNQGSLYSTMFRLRYKPSPSSQGGQTWKRSL